MGTPQHHLPPALSDATIHALLRSLHLPLPASIQALQVASQFRSIYVLEFPVSTSGVIYPAGGEGSRRRVDDFACAAGGGIRVRFDTSTRNPAGYEFTLLEKVDGVSVDKTYASLSQDMKVSLVKQVTNMLIELNTHAWQHIGGLQIAEDGKIVPGPVLEDTFWMEPYIENLWPVSESFKTLNPTGPYDSHAGLIRGYLERFVHAINVHPSLAWPRDVNPRLESLIARLPTISALSLAKLILAHKDLHFANIMATPDGQITTILDWEFAGVVPALRWDPVGAFLWNGEYSDEAQAEKEKMRAVFEKELKNRGVERWWEEEGGQARSDDIEEVWTVVRFVRFVRALVEVCPRGEGKDKMEGWRRTAEEALEKLGV